MSNDHRDMFVGMDPQAQFEREMKQINEAAKQLPTMEEVSELLKMRREEIAMSNGSKEQGLPGMDVGLFRKWAEDCPCWDYACPQFQAQQALARIATLSAQVELARNGERSFAETLEAIRVALGQDETHYLVMSGDVRSLRARAETAEAELSALREGATVTAAALLREMASGLYCRSTDHMQGWCGCADAKLALVCLRERILGATAEPTCKHCGPSCIPGAAHNAHAEDGVVWTPDTTGGDRSTCRIERAQQTATPSPISDEETGAAQ